MAEPLVAYDRGWLCSDLVSPRAELGWDILYSHGACSESLKLQLDVFPGQFSKAERAIPQKESKLMRLAIRTDKANCHIKCSADHGGECSREENKRQLPTGLPTGHLSNSHGLMRS